MTANSIDIEHIYEKGLEPVDFIKYTLPLTEEECEELMSLGIGAELLPLEPTHICSVLTNEQCRTSCFRTLALLLLAGMLRLHNSLETPWFMGWFI